MDKIVTRVWTDYKKLYFEDGSYIYTNPMVGIIEEYRLKDKTLPKGLYMLFSIPFLGFRKPLLYLEELEWYEVDDNDTLHFIGYTTDANIRESISRRFNSL